VTEFDRYAVQIRTRSEAVAFASLDYYGFESYCPQVKTWRQYSDRLKFVTEPVSPVRLFCRCDLLSKSKVFSSNTLERVVGFGAQAAPVSTSEIEAIRRMIDEGDATFYPEKAGPCSSDRRLPAGHRMHSRTRVCVASFVISVQLLQRSVSLSIERSALN
jgi:Transcription termination factor nusG